MVQGCMRNYLKQTVLLAVSVLLVMSLPPSASAQESIADVPKPQFPEYFRKSCSLLRAYSDNLEKTVVLLEKSKVLKKGREVDFDITEKNTLNLLWGNSLDYIVAIDGLMNYYQTFYLLTNKRNHEDAFLVAYAALLAKYANSLKIIRQTIDNDLYEKTLNDTNQQYGIPSGMFARLKWNTIHVQDLTGVVAGYQYYQFLSDSYKKRGLVEAAETSWMFDSIQRNYDFIAREMNRSGVKYFAKNGLDIVKETSFKAWFPLQTHVSEWMGDTKVKRLHKTFIASDQINTMKQQMQPGDIVVERKNWYLSNVGLPGFWPHAELFIGTYNDMTRFFGDPEVVNYYKSLGDYTDFIDYLTKKYPERMREYRGAAPDGHPHQIIEAVSEGVKFSSLEEGALADYIGVMRPRLSKLDIAKAVDEAFHYVGTPYDFNFDFLTDSSIVCSELIYKVYKNGSAKKGLALPLREIAGRKAMPPNDIVEKFDREYDTAGRELDFVYFLDGQEKDEKAISKDSSELRSSHRRVKWDIAQK